MAEYIEREAAIEAMAKDRFNVDGYEDFRMLVKDIEELPAADVVPVVHGEWIPYNLKDCLYSCSNCHSLPRDRTEYCPNCGARMDGGT